MTRRRLIHIGALGGALLVGAPALATLPPDAQALLNTLPGKTVSLPVVLGRAMESSDSFRLVEAARPAAIAAELRGMKDLDTYLKLSGEKVDDRRQPPSPFMPSRVDTAKATVGLSKYFSTGSQVALELSHGFTEYSFSGTPFPSFMESRATLSLMQNLWKDGLGYGVRRREEAGRLRRGAEESKLADNTDGWAMEIAGIFYDAWLAQAIAAARADEVDRRETLLRITRAKLGRGTAERPDVLQIESALLGDRVRRAEALQQLGDRWRGLVTSLKLPETWLNLDPQDIPIELDEPVEESLSACSAREIQKEGPSVVASRLEAQAAQLEAESAANAASPALQLKGSVFANGLDGAGGEAVRELLRAQNPGWMVGVELSVPLGSYNDRAEKEMAAANRLRTEAQASINRDMFRLQWINSCLDLKRLRDAHDAFSRAFTNQKLRARLDEQRFSVGRIPTNVVVQAGDDATRAEMEFHNSSVKVRLAAWKVRRLAGLIPSYLGSLKKK